jgi:hypothetical protein
MNKLGKTVEKKGSEVQHSQHYFSFGEVKTDKDSLIDMVRRLRKRDPRSNILNTVFPLEKSKPTRIV